MAKIGRPNALDDPETMAKIKQAFAIGATDEEACAYAKIGTSSLYRYQEQHEDFREEKERLKKEPILKAKNTVVQSLDNVSDAQWYLERKSDFAKKTQTDLTTGGEKILVEIKGYEDKDNASAKAKTSIKKKF